MAAQYVLGGDSSMIGRVHNKEAERNLVFLGRGVNKEGRARKASADVEAKIKGPWQSSSAT